MLSRIAESLFWIGRYVERADGTARIVDAARLQMLEETGQSEEITARVILQVIMGLSLLSYAVNLFIFVMGWVRGGLPPIVAAGATPDFSRFADPLPQALVLTAIVIGFATTALLLVVLLAARGFTGTDHVDGQEPDE